MLRKRPRQRDRNGRSEPLANRQAIQVESIDHALSLADQLVAAQGPEAGAAGSIEELRLIRTERGARSDVTYDGYYPSLHLTFNATENFVMRAAYAETFGRPDLTAILPNTSVGTETLQPAPGAPPGNITVTNPGLKPYSAKNYDLSLEYYFTRGGVLSRSSVIRLIVAEAMERDQLTSKPGKRQGLNGQR